MSESLRGRTLALLRKQGRPVSVRELVSRLSLSGDARRELKRLLRSLLEDGEIVKIRGSRVGLPSRMNLVVGRLTCNPAGYGFVSPERPGQHDVYVAAGNLGEALHGDRVVARLERETAKGWEGRVIRILERALQRIVGRFEEEGRFGGRVVPFDRRVLHELFVPEGDTAGAESGEMVAAEMTRPPTATRNPIGRVLDRLGRIDEPGVDLKVIVAKYGLPDSFPEEVERAAEAVPRAVRPQDLDGRRDFRGVPTVTIDPETARDHDDAVGLERVQGGWRLAVHIADVDHYVPEGSPLDQEAYLRGTSIYFPDRVVPMLPEALSSGICSLVEGEDRLTQTALIELDATGRVTGAELCDGVIRSDARLSYQEAQAIVDGDAETRQRYAALVPLIEAMDELARLMRKRRYARGSLDFDLPQPKLVLTETGEMTGVVAAERLDSMRVIEEFMLAANEAVAERLAAAEWPSLYRIHETPDAGRVEEFCDLVASLGYRIPTHLESVRPQDFQRVLRQIEGKPEEKLVSFLLLRTMRLAVYSEENLGHFGLATDRYTHFTSPIRRYPDLVVHRALRAQRSGRRPPPPEDPKVEALPEVARHTSEMERRAAEAERELIEWKKVRFMADKLGEAFKGYVTGVRSFGLFVELEEIFVQGMVHVSSMTDDYYAFDERRHTLTGENTSQAYRLGDKVEVQVVRVDLERRQIDFALVDVLQRAAGADRRPPTRPRGRGASPHRPSAPSSARPRTKRGGPAPRRRRTRR
jgi:ribonuclease R